MKNKNKKKRGIPRLFEISQSKKGAFNVAKIITFFSTGIKLFQLWLIYQIISHIVPVEIGQGVMEFSAIRMYALQLVVSGAAYALLRYLTSRPIKPPLRLYTIRKWL